MWIGRVGRCWARKKDLLPSRVRLIPEDGAPGLVQVMKAAVSGLKPAAKGTVIGIGIKKIALAVQFVVDLPTYEGRMTRIVGSHLAHDALAQLAIDRRIVGVMAALTVVVDRTTLRHVEDFGVSGSEPGR